MKWFAILIAMLSISLIGCKGSPVVGTYKIDLASNPGIDKAPQAQKDVINKMRINFNADKTMNSDDGAGKKESGTWELKDKTLTVTSAGKTETATLGDDGSISMTTPFGAIKLVKA